MHQTSHVVLVVMHGKILLDRFRQPRRGPALVRKSMSAGAFAVNSRHTRLLLGRETAGTAGSTAFPERVDTLTREAVNSVKRQEDQGQPACLLVPDLIRAPVARLLRRAAPRLKVLAHSEIPDTHSIRIGSIIGSPA